MHREGEKHTSWIKSHELRLLPSYTPLSLVLSFMWLPLLGAAQVGENSTAACRRAVEIPDLFQKIYFRNSAGTEDRKSSLSTVCVRVLRGATLEVLDVIGLASSSSTGSSSATLRSALLSLHRQRLCGSVIPAFGLQRYEHRNSPLLASA